MLTEILIFAIKNDSIYANHSPTDLNRRRLLLDRLLRMISAAAFWDVDGTLKTSPVHGDIEAARYMKLCGLIWDWNITSRYVGCVYIRR